jgi:hypothetical protein
LVSGRGDFGERPREVRRPERPSASRQSVRHDPHIAALLAGQRSAGNAAVALRVAAARRGIARLVDTNGNEVDLDSIADVRNAVRNRNSSKWTQSYDGEWDDLEREAKSPADAFYVVAWPTIADHWRAVTVTGAATTGPRSQATSSFVTLPQSGDIEMSGSSGKASVHAESSAYQATYEQLEPAAFTFAAHEKGVTWAPAEDLASEREAAAASAEQMGIDIAQARVLNLQAQMLRQQLQGATVHCAGGKPSCFMCSAVAHALGVSVEAKDKRGYTQYNLPAFFGTDGPFVRRLVGDRAYEIYLRMDQNGQASVLRSLGSELYERHKGSQGNFQVT